MRFIWCAFGISATLFIGLSDASGLMRPDLDKVFSRPLIVGASVSVGMLATGPGDIAARLVNGGSNTVNVAENGAKGKQLGNISSESLAEYSVIIGVDYLFWDSIERDPTESLRALRNLVRSARKAGVPLVLGDIPKLVSEQVEASRAKLNGQIHAQCRRERRCYVLEIDKLHRQASGPGIVIGEYLYRFADLTVDGLHTNRFANDYLARKIISLLSSNE